MGLSRDSTASLKNKLKGLLKKLNNFNFLLDCLFFKHVLSNIAKLSLTLERQKLFMFELPLLLDSAVESNVEINGESEATQ